VDLHQLPIADERCSVAESRVLELSKVCKSFDFDPVVTALVDIDLIVNRGDWLAITGPSGSGKSTLLNIIGCLDQPSSGSFRFDGIETTTLKEAERAGLRSQRIGFVFQSFHLLPHRTATENVMLPYLYGPTGRSGRRAAAVQALDRVGLAHRRDALPARMSGGERQRVAIARALANRPSLVLCDEPTGNLDSTTAGSVLALLDELHADGMTIVVITHDPNVAARAGRPVTIRDGRVAAESSIVR